MNKYIIGLLFLVCIPFVVIGQEYTIHTIPNPKEADINNYVSNPDGILSSYDVAGLNSLLVLLERDTHAEVAVVAVNSIGNEDIKQFAIELFEEWGIGKSKIDNGLLIFFVMDQRAITFEVGYGLEGVIPDVLSRRIQTQDMIPYFRDGDYGAGIIAGVEKVDLLIREEPVPEYEEKRSSLFNKDISILLIIFIAWCGLALLLIVGAAIRIKMNPKLKTNQDQYLALKKKSTTVYAVMFFISFFGVFVGMFAFLWVYSFFFLLFIIGLIPIHQVAKSIQRSFRSRPIPCNKCKGTMQLISENEDNQYLSNSQDFEEKIKSVDYDVFLCHNCNNIKIFSYNEDLSSYMICSKCKTRALKKRRSKIIKSATYSRTGLQRLYCRCEYCRNEETKDVVIPVKERSSSGSSSSGGSSGSSSSGGSFGGGRSGGGGATSRW